MTFKGLFAKNIEDGETIHQRCLLLKGTCISHADGDSLISIKTTGTNGVKSFPEQTWPSEGGHFKALVMLAPGQNILEIDQLHDGELENTLKITITYIPLLQNPPLHLAIMVAKDSPLLIDCPPSKGQGYSSTHADIEAAIAKFRMTAYMWQAFTAEEMRLKGFGRRSFRLDEEWAADTVSRSFFHAAHNGSLGRDNAMRSTAKVHVVRSSYDMRQLRDPNIAQQNPSARRKKALMDHFLLALKEAGGPFAPSAHPVVAGLILDSHYEENDLFVRTHAAASTQDPNALSLGIFGSHLTYSWPRFLEEVTSCLTDTRETGPTVHNDNGECDSMWETCAISQGSLLREVGHAFGLKQGSGIMNRDFAQDWPKNFLSKTAYCRHTGEEGVFVDGSTSNTARWNLHDALSFRSDPHFSLPGDRFFASKDRQAVPCVDVDYQGDEELDVNLRITSPVGIVQVTFNDEDEDQPSLAEPVTQLIFTAPDLENRFDPSTALELKVLGFNGKQIVVKNVWKMLAVKSFIRIPRSNIRLYKRSVYCRGYEDNSSRDYSEWAQLLKEKGPDGGIYRATGIELRVGAIWDGAIVRYEDGHVSHWGPMHTYGVPHQFGGGSFNVALPENVNIKRIDVNLGSRQSAWGCLPGARVLLSNRTSGGHLNDYDHRSNIVKLRPSSHEVIVGFYGKSESSGIGVVEFGIITAPKSVGLDGLPDQTFDLQELRNNDSIRVGVNPDVNVEEDEEDVSYDENDEDDSQSDSS